MNLANGYILERHPTLQRHAPESIAADIGHARVSHVNGTRSKPVEGVPHKLPNRRPCLKVQRPLHGQACKRLCSKPPNVAQVDTRVVLQAC